MITVLKESHINNEIDKIEKKASDLLVGDIIQLKKDKIPTFFQTRAQLEVYLSLFLENNIHKLLYYMEINNIYILDIYYHLIQQNILNEKHVHIKHKLNYHFLILFFYFFLYLLNILYIFLYHQLQYY